eukprot:EG_transcript_34968
MAIEKHSLSPPDSPTGGSGTSYEEAAAPVRPLPGAVPEVLRVEAAQGSGNDTDPHLHDSPRSLANALGGDPASRGPGPWLRYSVALVGGVAALILLVGFLAWAIPFIRLQNTIGPSVSPSATSSLTVWTATFGSAETRCGSRMEALNKQFGTHCLASSAIYDWLRGASQYEWMEAHMRPM